MNHVFASVEHGASDASGEAAVGWTFHDLRAQLHHISRLCTTLVG